MRERFAMRRARASWAPALAPALLAATPAAAAIPMPDFRSAVNFTAFNWPTLLLSASIGLLIIGLMGKARVGAKPSRNADAPQEPRGVWRRIGNMPVEPPEAQPATRAPATEADVRRSNEAPLRPGFPV